MKSELVTALMSAGMPFEPTERPDQHRVVIVASRGAIPPPVSLPGDFVWNRGFNLLVLDKGGSPSHYCKCRPLDDHLLPHETRVRQVLSHDPRLSSLVPYACQTETRRFRLQASGYISGTPLNTMLRTLRPAELLSTLSQVLKAAEKVSRVAADLLPDLFHNDRPADLARDVDPALAYLGRRGVASVIITTLRNTLLAAGALPRRLQHGDLWPGNVVVTKRRWWILDFELFGQIQVPLYDACHLLRTSSDIVATPPSNDVWVNRLVQRNPLGSQWSTTLSTLPRASIGEQCQLPSPGHFSPSSDTWPMLSRQSRCHQLCSRVRPNSTFAPLQSYLGRAARGRPISSANRNVRRFANPA